MTATVAEARTLRPLTDAEADAVARRAMKEPVEHIARQTDLSHAQIAAAVDLSRAHAAATAENIKQANTPTVEEVGLAEPTPAENVNNRRPIGALLSWAETSGHTRAKALAIQVRAGLAELKQLHDVHDARAKAAAEVERLATELEAAQARLRGLGGSNRQDAASRTARKAELAQIRNWIREQGGDISERGQIPKTWVTAYHQAHSTTAP